MSHLLLNLRLWSWHVKVSRYWPNVYFNHNPWHGMHGWPDGWISVYQFFGWHKKRSQSTSASNVRHGSSAEPIPDAGGSVKTGSPSNPKSEQP